MRLCTDKVVADWLALTQKRVKQLRDMGVLIEKSPGLYDLRASVLRYVNYVRRGKRADLQDERALLAKAKRETAEMDNALRRGELHKTEELENGIKTILLNFRSRILVLPAKEAPKLAQLGGDQGKIFDELDRAVCELLEQLKRFDLALILSDGEDEDGGTDEEAKESL